MVLSDVDIRKSIAGGIIRVTPALPEEHIGSCSVDFRLGNEFSIFEHSKHAFIDLRNKVDIVMAEALDRFSRDQEDTAGLFKRLTFAGVKIVGDR